METHRKELPYIKYGTVVFGPDPYVTKSQAVTASAEVVAIGMKV